MPNFRAKSKDRGPQSPSTTNLQAPIALANINTPTSSIYTPSEPTPSESPVPAMETPHKYAFINPPIPDVYKKAAGETQRFSTTTAMKGLASAMHAAKRLQQVVGEREPIPFVIPPAVPEDLVEDFMEGLEEFGLDAGIEEMGLGEGGEEEEGSIEEGIGEGVASEAEELQEQSDSESLTQTTDISDSVGLDALCEAAALQNRLPDILGNMNSVRKAKWARDDTSGRGNNGVAPLVRPSSTQGVTGMDNCLSDTNDIDQQPDTQVSPAFMSDAQFATLPDNTMLHFDGRGLEVTAQSFGQPRMSADTVNASRTDIDNDLDALLHEAGMAQDFGSIRTFTDSIASHSRSLASAMHVQAPSVSYRALGHDGISSFAMSLNYGGTGSTSEGYRFPPRSSSLFAPPQISLDVTPADTSEPLSNHNTQHEYGSALQEDSPAPTPLFPSPRIEADVLAYTENSNHRFAPPVDNVPRAEPFSGAQLFNGLFREPPTVNVPNIKFQAPSPRKKLSSKKRGPSLSGENLCGPTLKGARAEDKTTGLPILPADAKALWTISFPGNTHALLTILLIWSSTMQSLYNHLPDPKMFPFHSAFPFPIDPPVYSRLVSASFYDTSVTPHKEIRFLGPGDAAELVYAEVDVFRSKEDLTSFREKQQQPCKFDAMKQKLTFAAQKGTPSCHTDEVHRAMTGEGRWAYILVKGYTDADTAPHLLLAWHTSAVTDISDCLHTIMPDGDEYPALSAPLYKPPLKRYASLQTLISPGYYQKRLNQDLRSASSSQLPQVDVCSIEPPEGSQTLNRTVIKFEKAGNVPLIEGLRVDVVKFRGFMDSVGRGQGKVILWRERS